VVDLDRELQKYSEYLDEMVEPIDLPVIEPDRAPGRPFRMRRLAPAVGAAVVIMVVLGLVIVLGPFPVDEPPFVDEPTTVSTVTNTTESSTDTTQTGPAVSIPEPPAISWTRNADPVIFGGDRQQMISGVTAAAECTPDGGCGSTLALVAVGVDRSGTDDFTRDAAVWVSPDGQTWHRVDHDESSLGGAGDQAMYDVASNGNRVVAVGMASDRPAVWISDDLGETWRFIPQEGDLATPGSMSTVRSSESGFLAAGDGFWVSDDGETWTSTGPEGFVDHVDKLTAAGSGWVAVGSGGGRSNKMWVSSDGYGWEGVSFESSLDAMMGDVVVTADGLVGFGAIYVGDMGSRPAVWRSDDGVNWTRLNENLTESNTIHFHAPVAIEPLDGWLVAIGNQWTRASWSKPRLWMSPDNGQSWVELAVADTFGTLYDPGSEASDLLVLEGRDGRKTVVVVGAWGGAADETGDETGPIGEYDGAVWIGTIENWGTP
jgi:hypothetical protein